MIAKGRRWCELRPFNFLPRCTAKIPEPLGRGAQFRVAALLGSRKQPVVTRHTEIGLALQQPGDVACHDTRLHVMQEGCNFHRDPRRFDCVNSLIRLKLGAQSTKSRQALRLGANGAISARTHGHDVGVHNTPAIDRRAQQRCRNDWPDDSYPASQTRSSLNHAR